ncbi:hypothetical protein B1748_29105 [Paenibacillus sp. MY03]|uniref:hypothetical protein n=1 Tax=Paenibacillus sp. MY03 TaxID=302980 RepID=UPI000B3C7277|nr:hypothetical protein [Paenibacillus sp. MY03]OUS70295.1 hypothetical protein B1748_29105 [Paenibacillus sp. MY03]
MAKVIAPNQHYSGMSASVMFTQGVGHTDNEHLLQWFEDKGYTVERVDPQAEAEKAAAQAKKEAEKRLKALRKKADELGIEGAADMDAETLEAAIAANAPVEE